MSTDDMTLDEPSARPSPDAQEGAESGSIEKHWRRTDFAYRPNAAFFDVARPMVKSRRTLLGYDRLYVLWQAARNVKRVPGAVAEVGSYRGGSAYFLATAFIAATGHEVPMHIFDTFEGHPAQAITEHDTFHQPGQFHATKYEMVAAYLSPFRQLAIHRGDVLASLTGLAESSYRLVHLDTDLYKPTLDCLEYFGRRMSPGGVIVIDDYASRKCPGVPKAVVEYLEHTDASFHVWDLRTEQLILTRW
jgi:O-methyltransferase